MDKEKFNEEITKGVEASVDIETDGKIVAEALVTSTMRIITVACEASMPHKKPRHGKRPVYWWTTEIADLRRKCLKIRRAAQRARHRAEANEKSLEHKMAKKQLRRAINQSKAHCWKKIQEEVNKDTWGLGYKIVTQKLSALRTMSAMDANTMGNIVRTLFPVHPQRAETELNAPGNIPLFTGKELEEAAKALRNKKAPGPDGIPSEVIRMAVQQRPQLLLNMYNACLTTGTFSSRWKTARLVLISKGKGDPNLPSSYRPLCMLDTAGKLCEKLIKIRLLDAIQAAGGLSPKQYGFRKGKSTIDAIQEVIEAVRRAENYNHYSRRVVLLVTLDVRNAFNSARWTDILYALEETFHVPTYLLQILSDYLRDRTLIYQTKEGQRKMKITAGAAQGSILGPDLWNIAYDSLLRTNMPDETVLVGYADDVVALIAARDIEMAQLKLNQVMRTVNNWMTDHGLSLALSKTEIVILTKKRIATIVPMRVGEEIVETKRTAKYLGVRIDNRLNFWEQIRCTADKAAKGVTALSRLMANVSGPRSSKRRVLMSATQSVLLYGAEVWADTLNKEMYRKRLAQVQRVSALRVASAYRTVSEPAALIIAGVIPIALLARERKKIYQRKAQIEKELARQEERIHTLDRWQTLWEQEHRGRWTARLIKRVRPWVERHHGEVNYYLTQFLSGHGYFRSYLKKMGKVTAEECIYCEGVKDDADHTFFSCERWAQEKRSVESEIGHIAPDTVVEIMLSGENQWNIVARYVEKILRTKKEDLDNERV